MPEDADLDIDFDQELARIQGQAAGLAQPEPGPVEVAGIVVTSERTVDFLGERFRISDKIGLMPLLKFSAHADMSTSDPGALAAMYAMLQDCIHPGTPGCGKCKQCKDDDERSCKDFDPGDWSRFEHHAISTKADADELLDVITKTIELISGRPTGPPSPSSTGRRSTRDGSTARSSARRARGSKR
jgi:hypothetical protein